MKTTFDHLRRDPKVQLTAVVGLVAAMFLILTANGNLNLSKLLAVKTPPPAKTPGLVLDVAEAIKLLQNKPLTIRVEQKPSADGRGVTYEFASRGDGSTREAGSPADASDTALETAADRAAITHRPTPTQAEIDAAIEFLSEFDPEQALSDSPVSSAATASAVEPPLNQPPGIAAPAANSIAAPADQFNAAPPDTVSTAPAVEPGHADASSRPAPSNAPAPVENYAAAAPPPAPKTKADKPAPRQPQYQHPTYYYYPPRRRWFGR